MPVMLLAYVADVWIAVTYALMTRSGRTRPYHAANAFGCVPIIAVQAALGAWAPLLLTVMFGLIGWWGVLQGNMTPRQRGHDATS